MKFLYYLSSLFILLNISSCSWYNDFERDIYGVKDSTSPPTTTTTTPTSELNTIKYDGTTLNISNGVTATLQSQNGYENLLILLSNGNPNTPISVSLSIVDINISKKSYLYDITTRAQFSNGITASNIYLSNYGINSNGIEEYSIGKIEITDIDKTKKSIVGTYTFVGLNIETLEKKEVSGNFNTTYVTQ